MKIAIASDGKDESSKVSEVTGRAPYFLIYENGKLIETISNPFKIGGGAGFSIAQMLYKKGVELVISGKFGSNVLNFFKEKGLKTKSVINKTVKKVLDEL